MNYPIAGFLIEIKNAYMAGKKEMTFSHSKAVGAIGKILKEEGFIKNITEKTQDGRKFVVVELLYKNRRPKLREVHIVSKPSVHHYVGKNAVPRSEGGFALLSTNRGIMTGKSAKKQKIGGEVICLIS